MKMRLSLLGAAAVSLFATSASAVDWNGYVRVGPGQKQNSGTSKRCFDGVAQQGHGGIGRLGNECQTYGEFALSQTAEMGGVNYKALLMTNFFSDGSNPNGYQNSTYSPGQNLYTVNSPTRDGLHVNQIYVEGKGYDIAPNQTFWIGRRFYGRADVHFDDSFFVDMSGTGAGIDGINTGGIGSLALAVFRDGDDIPLQGNNAGTRLNADWSGINSNPGGKLRVTGTFTRFTGPNGKNGGGLSVQHIQTGLLPGGGDNTLWAQYTKGSTYLNMNFGGGTDGSDVKRWRIADSLVWLKGPVTAQTLLQYGQEKRDSGTQKFWSAGGRAGYAVTTNFKMQAEVGYSHRTQPGSSAQSVWKATIAPTLTVGPNYYDRPELRFYVSTYHYNDAYRAALGQTRNSKTAAGFQAEIWF